MRTDVKIGLAVGLGLLLLVVVYFAVVGGDTPPSPEDQAAAEKPLKPFSGKVEVAEEAPRLPAQVPTPVSPVVPTVRSTVTPVPRSPSLTPTTSPFALAPRTETPSYAPTVQPPPALPAPTSPVQAVPTIAPEPSRPLAVAPVVRPLAPTPVAAPKETTYTVKEGDGGLWAISEKVYGDGSHWELIQKANPQADPNRLRAGQTLVIPPLSKTPVATAGPASPQQPLKPGTSGQRTYTVVKGDAGFWGIAAKEYGNGQYWTLLAKANPGVDSNALKVGQVLIVPPKPDNNAAAPAAPVASTAQPAQANRTPSGSGASQTYTVQTGDNGFWGVAQKVYGNGKYHELIASANPRVDPQKLQVGQKLIIPPLPAGGDAASRLPQAPRPATSPGSPASDGRPIFD